MIEPLHVDLDLGCDVEHAFAVWTGGDGRCRVTIDHRGWERLGADAQQWRDAIRGGWGRLLPHFVEAAELDTASR